MTIDVANERSALARALRGEAQASEGAGLEELDRAFTASHRLFRLLSDTEAPAEELQAAADRLRAIAHRRADHPDADVAQPRAQALEASARAVSQVWGEEDARADWNEAAERWVEAAGDDGPRAKELLLRACDAFIGAGAFERAAGCYARALTMGEDAFGASRRLQPSRGAHRLKLAVLLLAAGKESDARAVNTALCEDLRRAFSQKVPKEGFEAALDRARALAEASALSGDAAGERLARRGAVDIAVALAKREAKRGGEGESTDAAMRWADEALSDALRSGDDHVFTDAYRRGARALVDGALAGLEGAGGDAARASCVRLLFDAGRRLQLLGDATAARECHERALELSPKFSPPSRRPADEMAVALFLLKGPPADPAQAEVHLRNASALVKALIQAAGVHEDHPSARLRQLALREAFYRRMGDSRRRDEVLSIMAAAAAEGAVQELEKAAVQYNAGSLAGARESIGQAVSYLERVTGADGVLHQAVLARSLLYHAEGAGEPPETAAERRRRLDQPFSIEALGFEWRAIERALLQMDPPAEFGRVEDMLQFLKGRGAR
jgi:tetratricopeptide (TPR) repeat protein